MKTTVDISDSLLQAARELAAVRGVPLREILEEGLRLVTASQTTEFFHLRDGSFGEGWLRERLSWPEMRDQIYEGRGA